jgi:hypothetical protein
MRRNIIVETELDYEKWYECYDWYLNNPIDPRLDVYGKPVIYNGWKSDKTVGYNINNFAICN